MVSSDQMTARFSSPCPFCARAIGYGKLIKKNRDGEWMHPVCADADDSGKTWKQLRQERQLVARAKELGISVTKGKSRRTRPVDVF